MMPVYLLFALVLAYLIGSLSFAVIVSRLMGLDDPRNYGSGNPGATNVLRSGNKKAAAATLLFDALKGWVPVWLVVQFGAPYGLAEEAAAWVGLAAFLGHVWPVFFGFQGGKGVATALGVLLGLSPWLGLATMATWLLVAFFFRYSSLAALVAAVFAPFFHALIWRSSLVTPALLIMAGMLLWRHSSNIRKLLNGTESKIGAGKRAAAAATPGKSPGSQ